MAPMMAGLEDFIAAYGLVVVLIGAIVEGETIVVMAGFLCHQGVMEPGSVFLAAFLGAWLGDQGLFVLGRRFVDTPFVQRQVERTLFAKVLARIEENPTEFILAFRFFYGFRVVSPIAVGISSIPTSRYIVLNALSAIAWAALMTAIEHKIVAAFAAAIIVFVAVVLLTQRLRRSA
jgi:membrane protein DedA with SNARE-associated domain